MFIKVLQIIAVIATILTGLVSLVNPRGVEGFTGLTAPGARGVTEIRSILGGLFIGLGIAVFLLGTRETYQMLGIMYLAIGVARIKCSASCISQSVWRGSSPFFGINPRCNPTGLALSLKLSSALFWSFRYEPR